MFDIGWSEMLLLAVLVLLVIGPKELPAVLRMMGRAFGNLRTMAFNFRRQIDLIGENNPDKKDDELI